MINLILIDYHRFIKTAVQISSIFTDTQRKKIQIFAHKREKVTKVPYSTSTNVDFAKNRLHYTTENHTKKRMAIEE